MKCSYDSGSRYGNQPLCDQPATHVVVYRNGSYGPFRAATCPRHLTATQARAYPGHDHTEEI